MASGSASYADCVSSLRTSLKYLDSSVETLNQGVSDFPRLSSVLKTVRVRAKTLRFIVPLQQPRRGSVISRLYRWANQSGGGELRSTMSSSPSRHSPQQKLPSATR